MNRSTRAWLVVVLLVILMMINFLDKAVIGMVAVPLIHELHITPSAYGFLAGSFFWFFAASGIVLGLVANRVSARTMLLWMTISWSLLQLPTYFSSSLGVFLLCRVLLGIGEGPAWSIAVHTIYNWFPNERRALPVGVLAQGAMGGMLLAGAVIPPVTAAYGWRANFVVLSVAGLAWVGLWVLLGKDEQAGARAASAPAGSTWRVPYRHLLLNRTVLSTMVMHFAYYWSLALVLTWLPLYLNLGLGFQAITAGRLFAAFILVNPPVNLGLCWVAQRLSRRGHSSRVARGVFSGVVLMLAGALLFLPWLTPLPPLVKIAVLAVSFGASTTLPSLAPAMLSDVCPPAQRAGLISIDTAIASVAGVIAPVLMGGFIQHLSQAGNPAHAYEIGFAVAGVLLLLGGLAGILWAHPEESARRLQQLSGRPRQAADGIDGDDAAAFAGQVPSR